MGHYDCKRCGEYGCFGECEEAEKRFAEALDCAGMSEKDYQLISRTRDVIADNYHKVNYEVGAALKQQLDELISRIKEVH